MNNLAQWLQMYDQITPRGNDGGASYARGMSPWGTMVGQNNQENRDGARFLFARDMMDREGGEAPDFFGGGQQMNALAPYVQPRGFNESMPQRPSMADPVRAKAQNYIMKLMGR